MMADPLETMTASRESAPRQPAVRIAHERSQAGQAEPQRELLAALGRIEALLEEVRRGVEASIRERRHREFSPARLLASILQSFVAGLLLWALSDWVFAQPTEGLFVKLGFAAVLQLGALTGFVLGREVD